MLHMALAFQLQGAGYTPTELATEAAVTLEPERQGFRITQSALTLRAQMPNLDEATFARPHIPHIDQSPPSHVRRGLPRPVKAVRCFLKKSSDLDIWMFRSV